MINLQCEHDKTKLVETKTKAGTIYKCKTCGCLYRLMLVVNDKVCWSKRFPVKTTEKTVKEKKKR
jgi:hypothetical protein